jgi:hypothetical protein
MEDQQTQQYDQRSKIKVTRNSKGDPQWEATVVEGADPAELERIRGLAVEQYHALARELS